MSIKNFVQRRHSIKNAIDNMKVLWLDQARKITDLRSIQAAMKKLESTHTHVY